MKHVTWHKPAGILAVSVIAILAIIGFRTIPSNAEDIQAIKDVLIQAETIADRMYIDANKLNKANMLEGNADCLTAAYAAEFYELFSENGRGRNRCNVQAMKKAWIDAQMENVKDGPDCVKCGVSAVQIQTCSIAGDTASVSAVLTKHLVDRVVKDGKTWLMRMEAEDLITATLIKEGGWWKIAEYESDPQYGESVQTLIEE